MPAPQSPSDRPLSIPISFTSDAAYFREGRRRFRVTSSSRWLRYCMLVLVGAALAVPTFVFAWKLHSWIALIFAPFFLYLFLGSRLDGWILIWSVKKSPHFNRAVHGALTPENLFLEDDRAATRVTWSAFTRALIWPDGMLLFQGARLYNWLPQSAFGPAGDYDQACRVVRLKVPGARDV